VNGQGIRKIAEEMVGQQKIYPILKSWTVLIEDMYGRFVVDVIAISKQKLIPGVITMN
jgi:hypothetical protein